MEIAAAPMIKEKISGVFLKEKVHFLKRREINWPSVTKCAIYAVLIAVFVILVLPSPQPEQTNFHERTEGVLSPRISAQSDPTEETLRQLSENGGTRTPPASLDHLYVQSGYSRGAGGGGHGQSQEQASSMILSRTGLDAKTQLPPGSRLVVRLFERAVVAGQGMPVIGLVTKDYVHEGDVAIPEGSKLFGSISFDDSSERASVDWNSIQLPDGRTRQMSAIGIGTDGQVGVAGRIRSEAIKNAVGQTLTRFIGAYAEGSMQRGMMGGNPGGSENGWKNAVAETAKEQAEAWANDMRKEKRWIEVSERTEFHAVLSQAFAFRDPGATYGN